MTLTVLRAVAAFSAAALLPAAALSGGPANAAPSSPHTRAAAGCVGTVKVTNLETSASLGRITRAGGNATPTKDKSAWTSFKVSRKQIDGELGQLKVAGTKTAFGAYVGGVGESPYDEMQPGTGDNLVFAFLGSSEAPTRGTGLSKKIWKVNVRNGTMRAIWTQPDSSLFPVSDGYQDLSPGGSNYLGSAVDFPVFDSAIGGNAIPVSYTFVPARGSSC